MPPGSKKRKAARRKREIADGCHSPSSPTSSSNRLQGEEHRANSGATSGDEEVAVVPADGPVRARDGEGVEVKEAVGPPHGVVEDSAIRVDKSERLETERAMEDLSGPPASKGALQAGVVEDMPAPPVLERAPEAGVVEYLSAPPVSEGAVQGGVDENLSAPRASEGAPEAGVVGDLPAPQASNEAPEAGFIEGLPAAPADVSAGAASSSLESKEKSAPLLSTSERIPVTQTEKRATWWNCCGLLDLITRS